MNCWRCLRRSMTVILTRSFANTGRRRGSEAGRQAAGGRTAAPQTDISQQLRHRAGAVARPLGRALVISQSRRPEISKLVGASGCTMGLFQTPLCLRRPLRSIQAVSESSDRQHPDPTPNSTNSSSSSAPTRQSTTAASQTTAGCRSYLSRFQN